MKILIYDNDINSLQHFCNLVNLLPQDVQIDKIVSIEDLMETYKKHSYDVVFIDFNDDHSIDLKIQILEHNPLQRIVSINNNLYCKESNCDSCRENTNSYRIFKPYNISELLKSFQNVKCEMNYCENNLNTKLTIISKSFKDLIYDHLNYKFIIDTGDKDILKYTNLIKLTELLSKNNIKYEVNKNHIQVFDN